MFWFFTSCSINMMILLAIDRFICIVFPFQYKHVTIRKLYCAILFAFIFSVGFAASYLTKFHLLISIINNNVTVWNCKSNFSLIGSLVDIILLSLLPFLLFLIFNIVSTRILLKSLRDHKN